MREIRAATDAGRPDRANEDAYALLPTLAVVADGATSPPELGDGCVHGPAWYAHRLVANISARHEEQPRESLSDTLAEAIARTSAAHADTCDLAHPGTPSATVAAASWADPAEVSWLVLGDCTLILDHGPVRPPTVVTDTRLSNTSHAEREAIYTGGTPLSAEEHRARVAALVQAQRAHRNTPDGFWVAANDPAAARHALTGRVRGSDARDLRIALLTDGASRAVDAYGLLTWRSLMQLLADDGPEALLQLVRHVERNDPNGLAHPRLKASDDATAVVVGADCPA